MGTKIQSWQIVNGKLVQPEETSMVDAGRREKEDLEEWLKTYPEILGDDIVIIGNQIQTDSGPLDLLGIDNAGNTVVVELKRDKLSRNCLAQAIDYASDVASWDYEKLDGICQGYTNKSLEDCFSEKFEDTEVDNFNQSVRILLVGFSMDDSLIRMVEWLSKTYDVSINAIILSYVKTSGGDELLSKTVIIPEDVEKKNANKKKNRMRFEPTPEYWEAKSKCSLELAIYMKDLLSGVAKEPELTYRKWGIEILDFSDKKALGTDDQWDYFQLSGYRNKVRVKFWTVEFEEMKKLLDEIDVQPSNVKDLGDDWKEIHIIIDKNLVEQHRDVFIKIAEIQEKERIMLSEKN